MKVWRAILVAPEFGDDSEEIGLFNTESEAMDACVNETEDTDKIVWFGGKSAYIGRFEDGIDDGVPNPDYNYFVVTKVN